MLLNARFASSMRCCFQTNTDLFAVALENRHQNVFMHFMYVLAGFAFVQNLHAIPVTRKSRFAEQGHDPLCATRWHVLSRITFSLRYFLTNRKFSLTFLIVLLHGCRFWIDQRFVENNFFVWGALDPESVASCCQSQQNGRTWFAVMSNAWELTVRGRRVA